MSIKLDLTLIKIFPFQKLRKNGREQDQLKEYLSDIYELLESAFKDLYGKSFNEQKFYGFINNFSSKDELKDFMFSVRFLCHIENFISPSASGLKTLFLISFIESLITEKHVHPKDWLLDEQNKKTVLETLAGLNGSNLKEKFCRLFEGYFKEHGAFRSVFEFLRKYLTSKEKYLLIQKITFKKPSDKLPYRPICFDKKHCSSSSTCGGVIYCPKCKIKENSTSIDGAFKKLIRELYNMRSQLIHNAKYVHITVPAESNISMIFSAYKRGGKYFRFATDISYTEFKKMVVRSTVKHLLERHKNVSPNLQSI